MHIKIMENMSFVTFFYYASGKRLNNIDFKC